MKLHYYPDTDSLYIDLAERTSVDSVEVAPGVVADFDDAGKLVGIDIDHASQVADLHGLPVDTSALRLINSPGVKTPASFEAFQRRLSEVASVRDVAVGPSDLEAENTLHLGGALEGLLYVKVANARGHGFWGASQRTLDLLRESSHRTGLNWYLVLLHHEIEFGYVFVPEAVEAARKQTWSHSTADHQLKINAPGGLAGSLRFSSIEELFGILHASVRLAKSA